MGITEHYRQDPVQTGLLSVVVAGLVGPLVAALVGATRTLNTEIFHQYKDAYQPQDKIHEFAATQNFALDAVLAGFLVHQLQSSSSSSSSPSATDFGTAWIALASHQVTYLAAAVGSFGWNKTMLPSLGVAGIATYFAVISSKPKL